MTFPKALLVALMSTWLSPVVAQTQLPNAQPAINVKEAVSRAIGSNPEVQALWHAFRASVEEQGVARGGFYPRVDLTAGIGREHSEVPDVADADYTRRGGTLSLNQMLYDGFATRSEVEKLGYAKLARYYELLDGAESTAFEAYRAYQDVQRYRDLVSLAKENYVQHKQVFDQIEERVRAGVGRRVDLEQATGRLALSESNLLTEASNLHDVSARYQRVVGELPAEDLVPATLDTNGLPPSISDALMLAYQGSPAFNAAVENVRAAQAEAQGTDSRFQPRIDLRASQSVVRNLDGVDGRSADRVIELVLNYNLFNGGSDRALKRQYAERLNEAKDLRDKSCRDIRQTLAIAYNDIGRLGEQLRYLNQHQLSIEKAREAYRRQFEIGQRTLLDLLDTENEYFQARRAYTNAVYDRQVAEARTVAGMGGLLQKLELVRADLPTLAELGQDREGIDPATACPATGPLQVSFDKAALAAAAKPISALPVAIEKPTSAVSDALSLRVREWAQAWQGKRIDAYLDFYAADFKPEDNRSRAAWERARRGYVGKPGPIELKLGDIAVEARGANSAVTEFRQGYTSADYTDEVIKRLEWVRESGVWKIVRESAR